MEEIRIRTPENVEFTYALAGLGSRFVAYTVDTVLQLGLISIVTLTIVIIEALFPAHGIMQISGALHWSRQLLLLVMGIFLGAIYLGYYIVFEAIQGGQTPGKKLAGIRVIREDGAPVTIYEAAIRSFFRVLYLLFIFIPVDIYLVLFMAKRKRLGDMAAGTIVVRTAQETRFQYLPEMEVSSGPPLKLASMDEGVYNLVRLFLMRREQLRWDDRTRLAEKLALPLKERLLDAVEGIGEEHEEFLERLAMEYRRAKTFH